MITQIIHLTAEDDMELDETIKGLHTRLPEEVPLQCNAAALLEIDEEIATSGDKPVDADNLAFIRWESPSDEEEEDDSEVTGMPYQFWGRQGSWNSATIHSFLR